MDRLLRRGPDDQGIWVSPEQYVGLGHRRLAVLDVTAAGHQPMSSHDGRFVIVYNGEIYNFRQLKLELGGDSMSWQSNSDTEVILAAYEKWGPDCLSRFHGMFALAIWDSRKKTLFAARDRMGVKPFYYHLSDQCFCFASRPKALLTLKPDLSHEIDIQALRLYMECGFIPAPFSFFREIKKLPPAHYLLVTPNETKLERYWDFKHIEPDKSLIHRNENELLDELDETISRSVQSRMISDVPLGVFLSGGIDSSLVAACMAKHSTSAVKTFNIGFTEKEFDESPYAEAVAHHLGTEHHTARPERPQPGGFAPYIS